MAELTQEQIKELLTIARGVDESLRRYLRHEEPLELTADAGDNTFNFSRVVTNRLLVITHMSAYDVNNAPTYIRLGYWNRSRNIWPRIVPAPLVLETVEFTGELVLTEDMWPVIQFNGATANDDLHALVEGYWVRIPRIS